MGTKSVADYQQAEAALLALADPTKAEFLAGFFKTGRGHYGEGDRFLGITVPAIRRLARQFPQLSLPDCKRLLNSPYNEARVLVLEILVDRYKKGGAAAKESIYQFYLKNRRQINNWNLVDGSAPYIVGAHLIGKDRSFLYELAQSSSLWDRRIAVVATLAFIREGSVTDTLKLSELLLADEHDLMHKACGWMLREVGKRNELELENFLRQHQALMPRTMLRYAIERFPPMKRKAYLAGTMERCLEGSLAAGRPVAVVRPWPDEGGKRLD
jgi:3-methyladenine DNA glycosylase AlkD